MSDNNTSTNQEVKGFQALKTHVMKNKMDVALLLSRVITICFSLAYLIPIFGIAHNSYYKVLLGNGLTSALRLHQRLPVVSFSREFLSRLLLEDSFHYLFFTLIFLYVNPIIFVLIPVTLFAVLHSASYSLTLLDTLGQNSWWGARLLISIVEFQTRNILRLVAFTEIILMPLCVIFVFTGRAGFMTPFVYYHFVVLRYSSRRNQHTRNMFMELRNATESIARNPQAPAFLRSLLTNIISLISRLAPQLPPPQQTASSTSTTR